MNKLLSFGAIVWDIIEGVPYIGGAPFNLAAHAAKCRLPAQMLTRLGKDDLGERSLAEMERLGVGCNYVQRDAVHATPTVIVTLSPDGQPTYDIKDNVSYDFIEAGEKLLAAIESDRFTAFAFGTIEQRSPTTRNALNMILGRLPDMHVFYDVNLRLHYYSPEIIAAGLAKATILKLNSEEADVLSRMFYKRSLPEAEFARCVRGDYGIGTVLVTRGERGCLVASDGDCAELPGIAVDVADAVGAGDAFSAGFLAALCRDKSPCEAAEFANRLGAFTASRRGAIPSYSVEVEKLIQSLCKEGDK